MEKYVLDSVVAVYLGTRDSIQEISICKKEVDEKGNVTYLDLLTNVSATLSSPIILAMA